MTSMTRLLPLVLAVGAVACGDGDAPAGPTSVTDAPTLSFIQNMVFNESCTVHHGDDPDHIEAGLDLTAGQAHSNLVNEQSSQVDLDLVEPNDAENSYLIHKLEGRAGIVGTQMPPDGPYLSTEVIDDIKAWINAGAQNN